MYTIDLLKGEGTPIRSRPGSIAFACLIVAVPFLAGSGLVNFFLDGRAIVTIQRQQMRKLTAGIEALSGAVQKKETLEKEKVQAAGVLSEVKAGLGGYTRWSPLLVSLVDNLSDTLVLTKLEARQGILRGKVPARDDPTKKVDASVPVRELRICVGGKDKDSSAEAVRRFQETLRSSAALGPMLDSITVSQSTVRLDHQPGVLYELNCVLKPGVP
jgi:hypothetical protein